MRRQAIVAIVANEAIVASKEEFIPRLFTVGQADSDTTFVVAGWKRDRHNNEVKFYSFSSS